MHTYVADDGTRFHYNSDLSGDVIVVARNGHEESISGEALKAFMDVFPAPPPPEPIQKQNEQ